jgi:hypothetical protein
MTDRLCISKKLPVLATCLLATGLVLLTLTVSAAPQAPPCPPSGAAGGHGPKPPAGSGPQPPAGETAAPQPPGTSSGPSQTSTGKEIFNSVEKLFTAKPAHLIVQSIVPGGGTGGGARLEKDFDRDPWHRKVTLTGVGTIRGFSQEEFLLRFAHDPFTPWSLPLDVQDSFVTHIYARSRNLPRMPFYGIGPNANLSNQAFFSERDTLLGVDATDPLAGWIAVGGRVETLWHDAGGVSSPAAQSITAVYPTTPGLGSQPNLLHYELSLHPHLPAQPPFNVDYLISYGFYQDHDTGRFSFRRLTFNLYNNLYPFHTLAPDCRRIRNKDIFFTLHGLIVASDASAGHAVPFYLQPTLGGTNANNDPTLRGFKDFQFRGPNAILMQVEYNHRLWKYLGAFVFYDAGKVTLSKGDLNFTNLRQSYGLGASFWMNDLVLFKIYVGLGSGAGAHPYFGIPNFTGETLVTGRGPSATPWD